MIRQYLLRKANALMASRPPDFEIGPEGDRYMLRWFVTPWSRYERGSKAANRWQAFKRKLPNIYVHRFLHDDEDRALHDHPWSSLSYLLEGSYIEVLFYPLIPERIEQYRAQGKDRPTAKAFRVEGSFHTRGAETAHRVVLDKRTGRSGRSESIPVTTLFITGFSKRLWGFHCPWGWRPWFEFVSARDKGSIGRGCGED